MKLFSTFSIITIIGLTAITGCSKKKDSSPTIATLTANAITVTDLTAATGGGTIGNDGGAPVTARGVCWSQVTTVPNIGNDKTIDGAGTGSFSSNITGLMQGTTYYVRAYATNSVGTAYSTTLTFNSTKILALGDTFAGGLVAKILQPSDIGYSALRQHGLLAAPTDQSTGIIWGNAGTVCNSLTLGGHTDWYLPSKEELNTLFINTTFVNLNNSFYWSSTVYDGTHAWGQSPVYGITGGQYFESKDFDGGSVRAVRSF